MTFMATKYLVSLLPADHREAVTFGLEVEWRGVPWQVPEGQRADWEQTWSVTRGSLALAVNGAWEHEPLPSERTLDWCLAHRFTLADAVDRAKQQAHYVVVNGIRVQDLPGQ